LSALFSPFQLDTLTLRNRIIIAPMCQYSAQEGMANSWHLIHLGHLALSGAAMLFVEATAVEPEGRITPGDLGLWDETTQAALHAVIQEIRKHSDIKIALQLARASKLCVRRAPIAMRS
jgi:2,4-dienoyl-CoA reductase-like NADH-dependent reductase (Old Yellow Enzyme family)